MQQQPVIFDHVWPFLLYALLALILSGGMILISYFLGPRHKERATGQIYESGIPIKDDARLHFPVHFYIVAMFFVIFDLEAAFLFAWAISLEEAGWTGYAGALAFVFILIAVLAYEWRIGALDFGPAGRKILKAYRSLKNNPDNNEMESGKSQSFRGRNDWGRKL